MKKLAINSGDAFILVYSVDDAQSFDNLEQLRQTILEEREQAYLECIAASDSSSSGSSSLSALTSTTAATCNGHNNSGGALSQQNHHHYVHLNSSNNPQQLQMSSLASNGTCGSADQPHNQLHPNLGASNSANCTGGASVSNQPTLSPSRHWSLASLFTGHHNHHQQAGTHNQQQRQTGQLQQQQQQNGGPAAITNFGYGSNSVQITNQQHHHSSIGSSICSTSASSCSSSAENSRRSSISAAEAALRTRRTRKPPMVIVANKHDLPKERHLVNSDEIEALAVIDWNNGFVRASAALNWNIDEIFQQVLTQARQPPTLAEAIVSKRRKSLPPKLPHP